MASYDNLMTESPWLFRPALAGSWYSDTFAAAASSNDGVFSSEMFESGRFSNPVMVSGGSGKEVFVSKHCRSLEPATGRVAKGKSRRASKRSATTTTFITADPANFRQMVQQVTGVRFTSGGVIEQLQAVLMPRRAANEGGGLPTLDASAFLHDGGISSSQPSVMVAGDGGAAAAEGYFDSFYSFPTLESWRAV